MKEKNSKPVVASASSFSIETEVKLLRGLLKDQIRLNKGLEDQNLNLKNKVVYLETQNEQLSAKSSLLSKLKKRQEIVKDHAASQVNDLEIDMFKAKLSSSVLKSIVTPLEQELSHLKKRLSEAEACIALSSISPIATLPEVDLDTVSVNGDSDPESFNDTKNLILRSFPSKEVSDLMYRIQSAEMYVLSLTKTNEDLNNTIRILNDKIADLMTRIDRESSAHNELKETWKNANEQFIVQSVNFQREIESLKEHIPKEKLNQKSARLKSLSDHSSLSHEFKANEITLQAQILRLREELIVEKNKATDLQLGIKHLSTDTQSIITKAENDFQNIENILNTMKEEILSKQKPLIETTDPHTGFL